MPSPGGDALAAKLAELVAEYNVATYGWLHAEEAPANVLRRLLAWVAEQGAAPPMPDGAYQIADDEPDFPDGAYQIADDPPPPMPATDGNRPADARTGAAPATEPSEGSESVNRAHRRDDDPKGEGLPPKPPGCVCGWMRPDGGTWRRVPEAGCAAHVAPAPDAALRAALLSLVRAVDDETCTQCAPPDEPGAHRPHSIRVRAVLVKARAALSPDATGGEA